jgi:hypothetical protein
MERPVRSKIRRFVNDSILTPLVCIDHLHIFNNLVVIRNDKHKLNDILKRVAWGFHKQCENATTYRQGAGCRRQQSGQNHHS